MSKINVEFDTKEKTMEVSIDGKAVPNCVSANFSKGYYMDDEDEFSCNVVTMERDEPNDMRKYTQVMASESEGASGTRSVKFPGFLEKAVERLSKAQAAILKYFTVE